MRKMTEEEKYYEKIIKNERAKYEPNEEIINVAKEHLKSFREEQTKENIERHLEFIAR